MLDEEQRREVDRADRREAILFAATLLVGVGLAAVIFGVCGNHLSERQLFLVVGLWALPVAFGGYGFLARWVQRSEPRSGPGQRYVRPFMRSWIGMLLGLSVFILLLPLWSARSRRASYTALFGAGLIAVFAVIPCAVLSF